MNIKNRVNELRRRAGIALAGVKCEMEDQAEDIERLGKENASLNALVQAAAEQEGREFERQLAGRMVDLIEDRDNLLDLIKGNVRDVMIHKANIEKDSMDFWFRHPLFWLFATGISEVWQESKAANYLEVKMFAEGVGIITCTVQKQGMLTPHELRKEAEAERDAAKAQLSDLQVEYSKLDNDCEGLRERYRKLYGQWRQVAILLGGVDDEDVIQEVKTVIERTGEMSQELETLRVNLETATVIYGRKMAGDLLNPITDEWRKKVEKLQAELAAIKERVVEFAGQLQTWGYDWASDQVVNEILTGPVDAPDYNQLKEHRDRLLALLEFHPRAAKLMQKRKNFVVAAEDEPYFGAVYHQIRSYEHGLGRWTDEDQILYKAAMQRWNDLMVKGELDE